MAQGQRQIWESITRQISVKWWYLLESRTRAEVAAVKPALLKRSYILSICIKETSYIWKLFHIRFRLYIYLFFLYVISLDGYLGSGTLDPNKERHGFLEMFVLMGRVLKDFKVLDKYWKTVELEKQETVKVQENVEKCWKTLILASMQKQEGPRLRVYGRRDQMGSTNHSDNESSDPNTH